MKLFRKQKHIEGSIVAGNMKGFKRGGLISIAGVDEGGEFRVKRVKSHVLTFGKIRWYHRIKPAMRSLAGVVYWWCKVQRKKLSVWRLRRYDI